MLLNLSYFNQEYETVQLIPWNYEQTNPHTSHQTLTFSWHFSSKWRRKLIKDSGVNRADWDNTGSDTQKLITYNKWFKAEPIRDWE
jgi:hypothetical protein